MLEAGNHEIPFTWAELQEDFKKKNVHGALYAMVLLPFVIIESGNVMDLETGTDEDIGDLMKEMNEKSMDLWDNNPVMRPRFLSMFDEMMESGVIP